MSENILDLNNIENRIKIHKVEIEELGGAIFVKDISLQKMEVIQKATPDTYVRTVLFNTICKEDGSQYFSRVAELNTFVEKLPINIITEIMKKITDVTFPKSNVEGEIKN